MTGTVLAGRYRIGERIGGGGMALVYRAEDLQLGRDVAVKVLRGQFGSDEEFVRRFRREAQNAASLSHPNVVQIYDVGRDEEHYFIVMELVEGKTLKALIQQQGPLPIREAVRIAVEILAALEHAHTHRIVHRDIKPHNILIAKDGRVKVTDFGIARATTTDTVTNTGSIMGSAHYFSPEQANGQPTGEKSDIYSMGVVLYEMVTGTLPFQGDSPITVALKHIRERPAPPSHLNGEVPVELDAIIMRALEKEPADRFPSAAAMREALEQFAADHAAGRTHIPSGDFPTMDLRAMKPHKVRRHLDDEVEEDQAEPDRPDQKRRRARPWVVAAVVAALVLAAVGGAVWAFVRFMDVPVVQVPDIVGMPHLQAQEELRKLKLTWSLQGYQYSDEVPAEHVIRTDPPPGTPVKQGREIALVLSRGPNQKTLPDVRGKSIDDARALLESERFNIGDITYRNTNAPEGQVVDMTPSPLTPLPVGSTVKLTVSKGPLRVPRVVGLKLDEARRQLQQAGLSLGKVDAVPDARPQDTVLATNPAPDTAVEPGRTVDVTVSQGTPVEGTQFEKTITVPGKQGTSVAMQVVLVDVVSGVPNEVSLFQERRQAGEKVTVKGTFRGQAHLRILVDNQVLATIPLP
jgi:beta-lactam-binding protein with PASTA domain/predicted Ser/Thr protein kinase